MRFTDTEIGESACAVFGDGNPNADYEEKRWKMVILAPAALVLPCGKASSCAHGAAFNAVLPWQSGQAESSLAAAASNPPAP